MEIEKKIIKIPLWSVKRRPLFKGIDKYYAYAVGQGLDILKNADDFKVEKDKYYLEKNELVYEAEIQAKSKFRLLVNTLYEQAYKNNERELFSSNEHWNNPNTKEDLWHLFKMDSRAYGYILTFLRNQFLIKELTFKLFCRMVEVDFIELDVTEYEREYSSFKVQTLALKQEDRLRKINAGVLCGQCGSKKTMVVEYPHNEYQEAKIACRNCGNIWSTNFQRKII